MTWQIPEEGCVQQDILELNEKIAAESAQVRSLIAEVGSVIVGQTTMVERLLIGLFTGGHILLEGVPGLAKTLTVSNARFGCERRFSEDTVYTGPVTSRPCRDTDLQPEDW